MKSVILALIAVALPASTSAQSLAKCLSTGEAEGLMTFALPSAIRALKSRCESTLPATSALIEAGAVTAAKLQPEADKAEPVARAAFDKVAGLPLSASLGAGGVRKMIEASVAAGIAQKIKPAECAKVDRLIDILNPLPARNMAQLVLLLMEWRGPSVGTTPFSICAAPERR